MQALFISLVTLKLEVIAQSSRAIEPRAPKAGSGHPDDRGVGLIEDHHVSVVSGRLLCRMTAAVQVQPKLLLLAHWPEARHDLHPRLLGSAWGLKARPGSA